jgi:NDP-sugar pyrophosphorylase family protein
VKIIILAGGLGTRLRGILSDLPKSMAPIDKHPFLKYILMYFKFQGFTEFIISIGYKGDKIQDYFGNGNQLGVSIQYTVETELRGTAGAIKLAESKIFNDDFIVINGDTYFEINLNDIITFHQMHNALATIALAYKKDTSRYGRVTFNNNKNIISFAEKSENSEVGYINGGIYVFKNIIFDYIPVNKVSSLEKEILPLLVSKGLYGFPVNSYFIDIGIPEDYEMSKKELPLRGKL